MKKILLYTLGIALSYAVVKAQEKELPPEGGTPKGFTLPEKEVKTYDNGLRSVLIPWGSIPKANIQIVVKSGNIHENADEVWLVDLLGDLLKEGSTNRSSEQIADEIAGMGGDLSVAVSPHATYVSASVLYEFVPDAIAVMADILVNPLFPESEIERLVNDMKRNLSVAKTRPQAQASEKFYGMLYPDHPYGRVYPTEEILESFTIEKVKDFYDTNFGAKRTTVYVAGMYNSSKVQTAVESALGSWREGPEPDYPVAEAITGQGIEMIDRPDAPQSTLMMGLPVVDASHPDYIALDVTNSLLGGSFGSRITSNIREDKGYTYSPFSNINARFRTAIWYEQADVTTDFTGPSLREITKEIYQLQNEPPPKEELDGIKNYEAGVYVLQNSTPGGIISQLNYLELYDLPETYLTERVQNIYAVTPEQVSEMVKKYIRPEDMTIVLVGDTKKIDQQIKDYEKRLKEMEN